MATAVDDQPSEHRPSQPRGAASRTRRGGPRRASAGDAPHRGRRPAVRRSAPPRLLVVLVVLASLPIAVAAVVALAEGWTPVGAEATAALATGEILRGDVALVGLPFTPEAVEAAPSLEGLAHPGPFGFWLGALPYAIAGPAGIVLVAAAVNVAAAALAVVVGWRRGGAPLAGATAVAVLVLTWSVGVAAVRDPLPAHAPLLGWFAFGLLCWEVRGGRWRSLPWAVVAGAWVAQAQAALVAPVAVVALGTLALGVLDARHLGAEARRRRRRHRERSLAVSGGLLALLALPVLIDQVTGDGNLGGLAGLAGGPVQGIGFALRVVVTTVGLPSAVVAGSDDPLALLRRPDVVDVVGFAAVVGVVAWSWVAARARRERAAVALVQGAVLGVAGMAVALALVPQGGAVVAAGPMLALRGTVVLLWLSAGWALWRAYGADALAAERAPALRKVGLAVTGLASLAVVAAALTLPDDRRTNGAGFMAPTAGLEPRILDVAKGQDLVEVTATGSAARRAVRAGLVERLERAGIATTDTTGGAPTLRLWVVSDPREPMAPSADAVRVASADLVAGGELSQASLRRRQLRRQLDAVDAIELRSTGELSLATVAREYLGWEEAPPGGLGQVPPDWLTVDEFAVLARAGMVASPTVDPALVDQVLADARGREAAPSDFEVAVFRTGS